MPVSVSANVAVPTPAPSPPYPQARPLSADCNDDDSAHWDTVLAHGSIPAYHVYSQPIHKSDQDDRAYRVIKLQNGLQAVLVHDANTDKAAASLNVAVGHLSDPDDMPGMAHFCEHLLFMGTEQFPKENDYQEYLSKNGGSSNAYTAPSNTNYYYYVAAPAFRGALERFSGFFHSPLFSASCTLRELNAIESENKKNLQNDRWRIFQLNKHLTRPGHPWSKFGTGNKKTLTDAARGLKAKGALGVSNQKSPHGTNSNTLSPNNSTLPSPIPSRIASPAPSTSSSSSEGDGDGGIIGRETRRRLIEWWSKEYCAGRMSLTLIGRESLDELAELAATFFSPILNRGRDPAELISDHPFGPDERQTIIHVKTIMDFYAVEVSFPFPYQPPYWRVKPANFLAHFVGHEGPGSLHAYLKNKGWVTSLSAGPQDLANGFSMFKVTIYMTKEGFQNYKEVILACYKYLSLLRSSSFPQSYQDEIQTLSAMRFRFAEKRRPDSYATTISEHVRWPVPRSLVLSGMKLIWDWDEPLIREMLQNLRVDEGRVVVMAKDHTTIGKEGPWLHEPWYGTEYTVEKMEDDFVVAANQENDIKELFLSGPNEFVPTNTDVDKKELSQPLKRPILIKRSPLTEAWHKKDDQFWVPRAQVMIEARTPVANASARASVMTRLFTDLVKDSLNEYTYDAELAGLNYNVGSATLGLNVSIGGYNDKLHVLAHHVLERVKTLEIKEERLKVMKEDLKLQWENFFVGTPYQISDYYGRYLLADQLFSMDEKLKEIASVTVEEIQKHAQELLASFKYTILVNGNLRRDDAFRIISSVEEILGTEVLADDRVPRDQSRLLPPGCNSIWSLDIPNPKEVNASVSYYCQVGNVGNPRLRVTYRLLQQICQEPAFNILRTKEQLGYVVAWSEWAFTESIGLRILVQSEKDPKYVESRIEAFLVHMRGTIESMSAELFEEQKQGLIGKWNEKLKNLNEESVRFWNHIESGYLDFSRREHDAVLLQTVTKDEVLAMFTQFVDPASPTRSKLSIHLRPKNPVPKKFSLPAAQAFLVSLRAHNIPVDEEKYLAGSASEPPIPAVLAHWTGVLLQGTEPAISVTPAVAQELLKEIEKLGAKYPAVGEAAVELDSNVNYIEDGKAYRETLVLSGPAKPVEEFYDLPLSKF